MSWLAIAFGATALFYASIGFGGGSTYNALLALAGVDFQILPAIALSCNIIVVVGGTLRFARARLVPWAHAAPLVFVSAPFAWLGGLTPIKESAFLIILALSLLGSGIALLFQRQAVEIEIAEQRTSRNRGFDLLAGVGIGYLAGLVGIGGGIFLAPYLHVTRWAGAKSIAATASLFILVNSLAGLSGQLLKLGQNGGFGELIPYWPLTLSVLIGGALGSHIGIRLLSPTAMRRMTALLILYVALQLLWKITQSQGQ
jgi:uncharacterized protein